MPAIKLESFFSLSDYFGSWGFGDGDDHLAKKCGLRWRSDAIRFLNNHLERARIPWRAYEHNLQSPHNDLRIQILDEQRRTVDIEVTDTDNLIISSGIFLEEKNRRYWSDLKEKVWPVAFEEFENWVLLNEKDARPEMRILPMNELTKPDEILKAQQLLNDAAEAYAKIFIEKAGKQENPDIDEGIAFAHLVQTAIRFYRTRHKGET